MAGEGEHGSAASITYDELAAIKQVGDAEIDPSGRRIAYTVAESTLGTGEPSARSRIWIAEQGAEPYAATAGPGSDDMPEWSPDGSMLAFRSDRVQRGTAQLYLLQDRPGEPVPLHAFPAGVGLYSWSPDGKTIAAIALDPPAERAEGDDAIVYEDDAPFARIWLIDIATGAARPLTTAPLHAWEFCWAPDGSAIAALVSDLPLRRVWYEARLVRISVASGAVETLLTPDRQLARPAWSPDGRWIAAVTSIWSDPGMTGGDVLLVPAGGGAPRNLTEGEPRSHLSLHWRPDSASLLTTSLERGQAAIGELALHGGSETLWRAPRSLVGYGMSVDASGQAIATTLSGMQEPAELWRGELRDGDLTWHQLTQVNEALAGRLPGEVEEITWRAPDGQEISGLLALPARGKAPYPLFIMVHGGPTGSAGYQFPSGGVPGWIPPLLERGVAVLAPNFRGSAGWGRRFAELNQRDMGGRDLEDVLGGSDALVERGVVDPARLAIGGWSYGGYLSAWAVTQTDRFKAAIVGAGISDWVSFHGTSDIPAFDSWFYRADPYAAEGPYRDRSPILFADRVTTPTLLLHGERDHICPVGQAQQFFRVLRERGVETQLVIYPREGHPIREGAHRRDMYQRGLDWITRHLGV